METGYNKINDQGFELHVKGLPSIWVQPVDLCSRCKEFGECLGFISLSESEWEELNKLISDTCTPEDAIRKLKATNLVICKE